MATSGRIHAMVAILISFTNLTSVGQFVDLIYDGELDK